MDKVFKALADPTRRLILDRLYENPGQTMTSLIEGLDMRRQSAAKHLDILQAANLVSTRWHGREKQHYLNPIPIADIGQRWIDKFSGAKAETILNLKMAIEQAKEGADDE